MDQQATIEALGLVDVRAYDAEDDNAVAPAQPGTIIGWTRDAQDHDFGTIIEPDGRVLSDASGPVQPFYLPKPNERRS